MGPQKAYLSALPAEFDENVYRAQPERHSAYVIIPYPYLFTQKAFVEHLLCATQAETE